MSPACAASASRHLPCDSIGGLPSLALDEGRDSCRRTAPSTAPLTEESTNAREVYRPHTSTFQTDLSALCDSNIKA